MNVVICWTNTSGYMSACWRAFAARSDINFARLIAYESNTGGVIAFKDDLVEGLPARLLKPNEQQDAALIRSLVLEGKPDVVVIPGWANPAYLALARDPALSHVKFFMTMDTPRRDTWRQKLGRFKIGWLVDRLSAVIVPGERAWQLAKLLGFPEQKIRRGMYGVDYESLSKLYDRRVEQPGGWPKKFLFTGRYVEEKGIDVLLDAYRAYRSSAREGEPWSLTCCGAGPYAKLLDGQPGVTNLGFVQPKDQHEVLAQHGVFVLPSRYDPWPLVIVEACAAGLPVVHTQASGSAVELVRDYYTGRGVATGDVKSLADALRWCAAHYDDLPAMGRRAQPLAEPYSAGAWASRWTSIFTEFAHGNHDRSHAHR